MMVWCCEAVCWATYLGLEIFKSIESLKLIAAKRETLEVHENDLDFWNWLNIPNSSKKT